MSELPAVTVPDMGYTAHEIHETIALTLAALNDRAPVPLPLRAPDDLAYSIVEQACSLRWSERAGGEHTDRRAIELGSTVLAFLLSRARAGELDLTAGDAA